MRKDVLVRGTTLDPNLKIENGRGKYFIQLKQKKLFYC